MPRSITSNVNANPSTRAISTPEDALIPGIPDEIDASMIWAAVERIHKSRAMSDCPRLMQFFRFVVASTLGGEAMHLKETTIGVAVFGRAPDYDPKVDTIVRSQAWRLRSKLKKYYDAEGLNESIVIELPIGHYVPTFRLREASTADLPVKSDAPGGVAPASSNRP
jgi:hypothetical protein